MDSSALNDDELWINNLFSRIPANSKLYWLYLIDHWIDEHNTLITNGCLDSELLSCKK